MKIKRKYILYIHHKLNNLLVTKYSYSTILENKNKVIENKIYQ